ncbi:MAG: YfhO family protein [Acidobacteriota bacterium]|nr:YfhO family protein [Acidobacteriota bacterium]
MTLTLYLATALALLFIAHECVTRLSRGLAIALLLLPLVFTGRALLTGRVYAPVEMTYASEPLWAYRAELGVPDPHNRMLSDIAFQMIPWREAVRRAVAHGEWPLLNRFEGCGDVLAGEAQPAPFSPLTLLALLLPAAASFGFTASIAFFLAALGAFLLARELQCSEMASFVCATVFTFAAPIALQILWPLGFGWALLPLVLMATRRMVDAPSVRSAMILTVALALEALAGHPETLLHVTAVGAVYGVYELLRRGRTRRGRVLACAISAGVMALLLSAIALLPFLDASRQTVEHRIRTEFFAQGPLRVAAGLPRAALLSDLLPFARNSFRNFLMARAEAGSIALALAIFALWRSRGLRRTDSPVRSERADGLEGPPHVFFVILGVVCLFASADAWPVAQLLHRLPLFNLALNDRLASAVPLCVAILAAFAVDGLSDRAAIVMAGLLVVLAAGASGMRSGTIDAPRFAAELVPLALAAIVVLLVTNRRMAIPILLALVLLQRTISDGALVPANEARIAFPPLALFRPLQAIREPFRVVATGPSLFPNTATMYGLEDARVMTAMTLRAFDETFPAWCRRGGFGFNQIDDLTRPMLSMLNVRFAIVPKDDPIPPGWRDVTSGRNSDHGSRLIENERVLSRAFVPRNVRIGVSNDVEDMTAATDFTERAWLDLPGAARDAPNGPGTVAIRRRKLGFDLTATMDHDGFVVISEAAWNGWRASVDGRPTRIVRANHAFLGVFVPAGRHAVRVVYLPQSFVIGRMITFITLALLITAAIVRARRRHSTLQDSSRHWRYA